MLFDPQTDITLIAIGLGIVSQALQRKLMNKKAMKANQEKMKEKQKKLNELLKKEDKKSKNEAESIQKEMLEEMNVMMKGSMRMMMASMIIFIPTFWYLGGVYGNEIISLPFPIPWFGAKEFIELYNETSWMGWYVLNSLFFSILFNMAMNLYEKHFGGAANA